MEIPLDGRLWEIRLPPYAVLLDIVVAAGNNAERSRAAALGLCLAEVGSPRSGPVRFYPDLSYLGCGCNPLAYGGAIIDESYRRRVPTAEFSAAAKLCGEAVSDAFEIVPGPPEVEEVQAAVDFTDPAVEGGATPL